MIRDPILIKLLFHKIRKLHLWLYSTLFFFSLLFMSLSKISGKSFQRIELSGLAQGTSWHITYYAADSLVTKKQVDSILLVIDSSLSVYKPYSRIVEFNKSQTGIIIDEHFRKVVEKSLDTYRQTIGLFDITVFPLVEAWGFGSKPLQDIPDSATISLLMACVSSAYLQLRTDTLLKLKPCVKIDVNGIAQGYSVDVIADFFEKSGIINYIVELGGELRVHGKKQPVNEPFKIGIETPSDNDFQSSPFEKILVLDSGAITTSGNYRKYHESKGKKFSHIIDPRTGYSAQNELISVTVYSKDAITADAYDNSLMLMGIDKAMRFVEERKNMAAFFIYKLPNGKIADTASTRFYKLIQP
ncbi:MAG: FAD:protein FMN transferase [Ferruginibacter sp.]